MKIGILSMQRIINNGSLLQAYGMKKTLEGLGHKVEFVDYVVEGDNRNSKNWKEILFEKSPLAYMLMAGVRNVFKFGLKGFNIAFGNYKTRQNFVNDYMAVLELTSKPNYTPELDVCLFGSDEVFNTVQYVESGSGHAWQLYGADSKAKKLISYAASFGHTTYDGLKKHGMVERSSELLGKFSSVSVRDKNSYEIIKKLTGKDASINIDPVLLYDFADVKIKKPMIENYILVYAYPGRIGGKAEIAAIKAFAKKHNKKLVCVNMMQAWCDDFIYAHPFDLLGYFKYADYVVTDTFHGAVISIKYNVPFISFIRQSATYSNSQKVGYLLHTFDLENRTVADTKLLEQTMLAKIDWDHVNNVLKEEQKKSMKYLKAALQ